MLKIVFLDAQTLGNDISLAPVASLGEYVSYPSTRPEEVFDRIAGFDVVITNKVWMGKEQIDSSSALKLICVAATGTNNVDTAYAASKGIPVRNAVDYSTESVTQVTWMHILSLVGKARYFDDYVKGGAYSASGCFTNAVEPFFELKGKTFGTVGLGNIGSRVAGIAEAFGIWEDMKEQFSERSSYGEKYNYRGGYGERGGYYRRDDHEWDDMSERRYRDSRGRYM